MNQNKTVSVGDAMPSGTLRKFTSEGIQTVDTDGLFSGRKVVLFAVPGAFTPTCQDTHFPGFMTHSDKIKAKGIDEIICMAVNDPFVMSSWGKSMDVGDHIEMLSDGNGDYARALGLTLDLGGIGLGERSQRFAAIVDDGKITYLGVEPGRDVSVSSAAAVLEQL